MAAYLDMKNKYNSQLEKMKEITNYDKKMLSIFNSVVEPSYRSKSNKYYNEELAAYYIDWNIANPKFNHMYEKVLDFIKTEEVENYVFTIAKLTMSVEDWETPAAILFLKDKIKIITSEISEEDANSVLGYFKQPRLLEYSLAYIDAHKFMTNIKLYKKHIIVWPIKFDDLTGTHNVFVHASYLYVKNIINKKLGFKVDKGVVVEQPQPKTNNSVKNYKNKREFCFVCGEKLVKGAKFCKKCGRKI